MKSSIDSNLLKEWATKFSTPYYVYDADLIVSQFERLKKAFASQKLPIQIHYSVKANSNLSLLKLLHQQGSRFDVVSGGEIQRCLKIGAKGNDLVFAGVGKSASEIDLALKNSLLQFNVESADELQLIAERANALGCVAPVALRINPDVDALTHAYITTGTYNSKFGLAIPEALRLYQLGLQNRSIKWVGLDMHIGSQMTEEAPILKAIECFAAFVIQLKGLGIELQNLDIGGGLGVAYKDEQVISPERFAELVAQGFASQGLNSESLKSYNLLIEPGRILVAEAGQLISRVQAIKDLGSKCFVIVDAGMSELMRPTLYSAHHEIHVIPTSSKPLNTNLRSVDVVGPICESSDFLAKDRSLPMPHIGDLIAVQNCGAYGSSMSHTYNTRGRCPELLWKSKDQKIELIRRRELIEDLLRLEIEV